MNPHPFYQAIIDAYAASDRPYIHQLSPPEARAMLRASVAAAPKTTGLPEMAAVSDETIDGVNGPIAIRRYTPAREMGGTAVYFHAGGWVIGDLDFADANCRRLAGASGCVVISVEYRKAPEYPYPAPLEDAYAGLEWAARACPGPLLLAGESSGGNLAAACAIRARDTGGPWVAGQLLAYPVMDHDFETVSYLEVGDRNLLLSTADMRWFWDHYCPSAADRDDPLVSPLRVANPAGLPPALILTAELDPLRDEGIAYARRLAGAGVPISSRCDARMVHGYLGGAGAIPLAAEALAEAGAWLRARADGA